MVTITLFSPLGSEKEDEAWLINLTNGQAKISLGDLIYKEEPVTSVEASDTVFSTAIF